MWKQIEDFNYEINKEGIIRNNITKLIKKSFLRKDGYIQIQLNKNGKGYMFQLHILLSKAFKDNPNNYTYINHIDSIRNNNKLENLEWCTQSQNMIHSNSYGLSNNKGSNNNFSKLTDENILEIIKLRKEGITREKVALQFNIGKSTISGICNGYLWKHIPR